MKGKLKRFAIIAQRDNVIQPGKENFERMAGQWGAYFANANPITLELACGRGEYSVGLAARFPHRNFVGIDIKGDRLWKGSSLALEQRLLNAAFLRIPILNILSFFDENEADEIWLTFPDPRPRKRDAKRRLTHSRYFDLYKIILREQGWFRLKTDNADLFNFTLEVLKERRDIADLEYTFDLCQSPLRDDCFDIKTRYEEMFSNETVKYLRFRFVGHEKNVK
ncbi:MAG: tRNA (guanosine(46)-N7)-methyltransferase TrmB [Candidatus Nephrothrix sp. EaCA]|nr:MAG: tRNA (guanosine(46)-N7)-methyltransferase TrmB [Candidatus Nephrothrix sp. EaCA]